MGNCELLGPLSDQEQADGVVCQGASMQKYICMFCGIAGFGGGPGITRHCQNGCCLSYNKYREVVGYDHALTQQHHSLALWSALCKFLRGVSFTGTQVSSCAFRLNISTLLGAYKGLQCRVGLVTNSCS